MLYGLPRASDFRQFGQNGQIETLEPRSDVGGRDLVDARFLGLPGKQPSKGLGSPFAHDDSRLLTLGDPDPGIGERRPEGGAAVGGPPCGQDVSVHRAGGHTSALRNVALGRCHRVRTRPLGQARGNHGVGDIVASVFPEGRFDRLVVLAGDHRQPELDLG